MNNTSKNQIITKLIIEGKQHIYKFNQLEWTNFIIDVIKKDESYIPEFEATLWIMEKLASSEIPTSEMVNIVKDMSFSTERLYHIVNNILYYYKGGPEFFKKFYGGYMNPQLESMVKKIEIRNNNYEKSLEKEKYNHKSI